MSDDLRRLAEALHVASPWPHRLGPDSAHCTNGSSHGERAEALAAALNAAGWHLVRRSEREALVSLLDEVDESSARLFNAAAMARAAIERRP